MDLPYLVDRAVSVDFIVVLPVAAWEDRRPVLTAKVIKKVLLGKRQPRSERSLSTVCSQYLEQQVTSSFLGSHTRIDRFKSVHRASHDDDRYPAR